MLRTSIVIFVGRRNVVLLVQRASIVIFIGRRNMVLPVQRTNIVIFIGCRDVHVLSHQLVRIDRRIVELGATIKQHPPT